MPKITIDGREYDSENLSDNAKQQLMNLTAVEAEIRHLQAQLAMFQTARSAYLSGLTAELAKEPPKTDS
ncbi:MAG TPA: hypothetical protein VJ728_08920 [Candidatus Binataceae bacterium]|nr:hypothetical protein [Candidatus Binataceae bacterium]